MPSTVAGAVRSALGREPDEVAGPLIFDGHQLLTKLPADLEAALGKVARAELNVVPTGASTDVSPSPAAWLTGHGEPLAGWIRQHDLIRYLAGEGAWRPGSSNVPVEVVEHPFATETRVGLQRSAAGAAEDGMLYTNRYLRPSGEEIALAARVRTVAAMGRPRLTVPLGGEARWVDVLVAAEDCSLEIPLPAASSCNLLLYLATPAVFAGGWEPPWEALDTPALVGAALGRPEPIASRNVRARRARPLRWAVPEGSVYYLRYPDAAAARSVAERWHGECLPQVENEDERYRTAGFGWCFFGRWDDE